MNFKDPYTKAIEATWNFEPSENEKEFIRSLFEPKELSVLLIENRFNSDEILSKHLKYLPSKINVCFNFTVNSITRYNELLTNKEFWETCPTENILIIQHDSALLKTGIEEFYQYDYVGAPWKFQQHGGNGGLSFRKKSAMLKVIENYPYNGIENEDVYFCNGLKFLEMNLAPREVCEKFSCETIFKLGTFGYHAIEKYLTTEQCEQIKNQYK